MEVTKVCSKCHQEKSVSEFYFRRDRSRYISPCKSCTLLQRKEYYALHSVQIRARIQVYQASHIEAHRSSSRAHYRRTASTRRERLRCYKKRNPERVLAHKIVYRALRDGTLLSGPCVLCGALQSEAHHPDYSKPLEVVWLCRSCHRKLHAKDREAYTGTLQRALLLVESSR